MFANAPWAVALVAATLLGMCAAISARAVRVPPAAADRLVEGFAPLAIDPLFVRAGIAVRF